MRRGWRWLLICWSALGLSLGEALAELVVYTEVPGLEPSPHYAFRVRELGEGQAWQDSFAFVTRCKQGIRGKNAYFPSLAGWTNSYTNFEMSAPVEVEIRRADGSPISKAAAHPHRKVESLALRDGRVYLTIAKPCLIAVDIDGQMDDQDTGKTPRGSYDGPPIHTLTVFANPPLRGRPGPEDPGVHVVRPGEKAPSDGDWKILSFAPGVHEVGVAFPVLPGRSYHIPGDALVYGTMANPVEGKGDGIRIFGYGTISGAKIANPKFATPAPEQDHRHDPIRISGARNTSVEGVTLADSAYHSLMLPAGYDPGKPTDIRWVKIFTWRANGDGINPFANGLVEDCFLRTQDDSIYVNGRGIRRVVFWNDHNGSTFVLSALPDRPLVVEDCDVIYARAGWHHWSGGRLFNMRGEGGGACGRGVVFRNIRVEDRRPTLQHFMIAMQGVPPYSDPAERQRGPGSLSGVRFQNIDIAAPSILGEPDVLWGAPEAPIEGLIFDQLTIGGKAVTSLDHFKHNGSVRGIRFATPDP